MSEDRSRRGGNRIHPDGHIRGGLHAQGLQLKHTSTLAGNGLLSQYVHEGIISVEEKGGRIRLKKEKELPFIRFGAIDELALRRAKHFITDNLNKWMGKNEFKTKFNAIYDNMVDKFKH